MTADYISRYQATRRYRITRTRLTLAIATGQVRAQYPGTRKALVSVADLERLLSTPPTAAKA